MSELKAEINYFHNAQPVRRFPCIRWSINMLFHFALFLIDFAKLQNSAQSTYRIHSIHTFGVPV